LARRLDLNATSAVVNAALDEGINFFDTADVYGGTKSEEFLGGALGRHRDDVVIATKFGAPVDEKRKGATHTAQSMCGKLSRTACAASGPTVSTSTRAP
jgi:aryl-alcohol dehydrogenase-like predicted oxidoreductase